MVNPKLLMKNIQIKYKNNELRRDTFFTTTNKAGITFKKFRFPLSTRILTRRFIALGAALALLFVKEVYLVR